MRSVIRGAVLGALGALGIGAAWGQPSVTIYNQNFGVVRDTIRLDLARGTNRIAFSETTAHLEPDSVILRDPTGRRELTIREQNFRADPVSQELLLLRYEGQTIDFQVGDQIVRGRIVRSGYAPHASALMRFGQAYYSAQMAYAQGGAGQPIIEVDGKLRFGLPGIPLFPALGDDSILRPTLHWVLDTDQAGPVDAELAYVTGGMTWKADYNIVAPEEGDRVDLVGWVTMDNQSGKTFEDARIKLMAGDVSKLQPDMPYPGGFGGGALFASRAESGPAVTERAFDEYHLYTLERSTTLRDRETKQVEFVRADGVQSTRIYVYDGAKIDPNQYRGWTFESIRNQREYGTISNPKIWVMREIVNSEANGLGIPLPQGRTRFYRRDGAALEFIGENRIDHTPKDETLLIYTGDAFDLVGERRSTNYQIDHGQRFLRESFEIKLRNHKKEAVEVRVVEHLYRGMNWEIVQASDEQTKKDARTIEFRVPLRPDEERTITYTAHYTW